MTIETIARAVSRPPRRLRLPGAGTAAVAAMVSPDLDLLFIRRAAHPGDPWSGHVSFPGGRQEPGDRDALDTAVRETREEIGMELDRSWLLGELDAVPTLGPLPLLVIRPFVFAVPSFERLRPNDEVASVHTLGIAHLMAGTGRGTMPYSARGFDLTLPRVDFDGVRLWGLTLQMVDDLRRRLADGSRADR